MTKIPLVMTIIGQDRPGLVQRLADLIADHDGNWVESRMAHLGGQFAGILSIDIPEQSEPSLIDALKKLEAQGITVVASSDTAAARSAEQPRATLDIVGHDRPGIVRQISQVLARRQVNVEELETECVSAPMSGEPLFKASATLNIPPGCDVVELRDALEKIAQELMADIHLADPSPASASEPELA